jgi:hypothetical protein
VTEHDFLCSALVRPDSWGVILRMFLQTRGRVSSTTLQPLLRRDHECSVMTKHRFIRCSPSALLVTTGTGPDPVAECGFDALQHWWPRRESERGNAVHWYDHVPVIGGVACCLSVDQAANGAVAHLTATVSASPGALPKPLVRLALSSWSHRRLLGMARVAESEAIEHRL